MSSSGKKGRKSRSRSRSPRPRSSAATRSKSKSRSRSPKSRVKHHSPSPRRKSIRRFQNPYPYHVEPEPGYKPWLWEGKDTGKRIENLPLNVINFYIDDVAHKFPDIPIEQVKQIIYDVFRHEGRMPYRPDPDDENAYKYMELINNYLQPKLYKMAHFKTRFTKKAEGRALKNEHKKYWQTYRTLLGRNLPHDLVLEILDTAYGPNSYKKFLDMKF